MKTISSKSTFFYKTIFPTLWFGFLAVALVMIIITGAIKQNIIVLIIPLIMAVFGFFLMRVLVWGVMDEVIDCGDYLIVKYRGQEDMIRLTNIININCTIYQNPPRLSLRLRTAGKFGDTVDFFPVTQFRINRFKMHPIAEELILRVDAARNKH